MATASILPLPRAVFYDVSGAPLAGGFVYTYVPNTTTPKQSWQDSAETIPNSNPVTLDAAGSCLLYGSGIYTIAVTDSLGNSVPAYSGLTQDATSIFNGGTITGSLNVDGNLDVGGTIAAVQFNSSGGINATSDINGGGTLGVSGNINSGGTIAGAALSVAGLAGAGTIASAGGITAQADIAAVGNIIGANVTTAGIVSTDSVAATGGITAGTSIAATGNLSGGTINTAGTLEVTGLSALNGGANVGAGGLTVTGSTVGTASGWQLNPSGQSSFSGATNVGANVSGLDVLCNRAIAASDARLKSGVSVISFEEGVRFVKSVPGRTYFKEDREGARSFESGFFAQDFINAGFAENVVSSIEQTMPAQKNGHTGPPGVRYEIPVSAPVAYHAAVLAGLLDKIEELERRLDQFSQK